MVYTQRVILLVIFLFPCPVLFAMDPDIARKVAMWRIQDRAMAEAVARNLQDLSQEIKVPVARNESEIETIDCLKGSDFVSYLATLKNGNVITAEFFKEGPFKGEYRCTRGDVIDNLARSCQTYHYLAKMYEKSVSNVN